MTTRWLVVYHVQSYHGERGVHLPLLAFIFHMLEIQMYMNVSLFFFAYISFYNSTLVVKATKAVGKGEEIFNCYGRLNVRILDHCLQGLCTMPEYTVVLLF